MTLDIVPLIMEFARTPIDYPINAKDDKFDYTDEIDEILSENYWPGHHGIVIDFGSGSIKAGLSGDDTPCKVFPPAIAYDEDNNIIIGNDIEKYEKGNKKLRDKHYVISSGF